MKPERSTGATPSRNAALDDVRETLTDLLGAERRLRGREQRRTGPGEGGALTAAQLRALNALSRFDEVTAGDLARSAGLNPASVTAMVDQLEAAGVVARRRSQTDRRVCLVSLTSDGRRAVEDSQERWRQRWSAAMAGVSAEDLAAADRVMGLIVDLFDQL